MRLIGKSRKSAKRSISLLIRIFKAATRRYKESFREWKEVCFLGPRTVAVAVNLECLWILRAKAPSHAPALCCCYLAGEQRRRHEQK